MLRGVGLGLCRSSVRFAAVVALALTALTDSSWAETKAPATGAPAAIAGDAPASPAKKKPTTPPKPSVTRFAGGYNGIGAASGMAMILEQSDDKISGRLVDGKKNNFQIVGVVKEASVSGKALNDRLDANFLIELRPNGVLFVFTPLTEDGRPDSARKRDFQFARGPVRHPSLADYRVAPPKDDEVVDVLLFLENYRSWSDTEVAGAFTGMTSSERGLFTTFDHLQADMMLRLCRGGAEPKILKDVTANQGLGCDELGALAHRADEAGAMRNFTEIVEYQRGALFTAIACTRQMLPSDRCGNVGKIAASAAHSWRNAEVLLNGYVSDRLALGGAKPAAMAETRAKPAPKPKAEATGAPEATLAKTATAELRLPKAGPRERSAKLAEAARLASFIPLKSKTMPKPRPRTLEMALASSKASMSELAAANQSAPMRRYVGKDLRKPSAGFEETRAGIAKAIEASGVKTILPKPKPKSYVPAQVPRPREKPPGTTAAAATDASG